MARPCAEKIGLPVSVSILRFQRRHMGLFWRTDPATTIGAHASAPSFFFSGAGKTPTLRMTRNSPAFKPAPAKVTLAPAVSKLERFQFGSPKGTLDRGQSPGFRGSAPWVSRSGTIKPEKGLDSSYTPGYLPFRVSLLRRVNPGCDPRTGALLSRPIQGEKKFAKVIAEWCRIQKNSFQTDGSPSGACWDSIGAEWAPRGGRDVFEVDCLGEL